MAFVQQWGSQKWWATSHTLSPVGVSVDNLLVASTSVAASITTYGWLLAAEDGSRKVLYRIADGTSDDDLTITHSSAQYSRIQILEVSGVDTANPLDTETTQSAGRWEGFGVGLKDIQPTEATSSGAGFGVVMLTVTSATTLQDRYDPSAGTRHVFMSNHAAVLPAHAASELVSFSWTSRGGGGDLTTHTSSLVLFNAAGAVAPTLSLPDVTSITDASAVPNVTLTF